MTEKGDKNLDLIWDVKVDVYVRLGKGLLPMKEIIALEEGTVVQLDQKVDEPVGLYVNDKLIAYGEVVAVDDQLGIRIKEIVEGADKRE